MKYRAWTNERLDEALKDRRLHRLTDVITNKETVVIECEKCNHVFRAYPHNLEKGTGCPKCAIKQSKGVRKRKILTLEEVRAYLNEYDWELLTDEYVNTRTKMPMRCRVCGHMVDRTFISFQNSKNKCMKCVLKGNTKQAQ